MRKFRCVRRLWWRQESCPMPHLLAGWLLIALALLCGCEHPPEDHHSERSLAQTRKSELASPTSDKTASARVVGLQLGEPKSARMQVALSSPDEGARSREGEALVPTLPHREQKKVKETLVAARRYGLLLYGQGSRMDCEEVEAQAPSDAWGTRLAIQCAQGDAVVELTSLGPDKQLGTPDDIVWRQPVIAEK